LKLPLGYSYATVYAGIRKTRANDLALIVSQTTASAAAVFTKNLVRAAPVELSRKHLAASRGKARAILVNAGNANCATPTAAKVALETSKAVARYGHWPVHHVLPASTGVIGVDLDPKKITSALPELFSNLSPDKFDEVARAIMTTDTVPKAAHGEVPLQDGVVRIAGVTKGSGMIHPNMATTLAFVMMDAKISPAHLKPMLSAAVERSYNRLSVDGDMSTNDTVIVLANGASGVAPNDRERKVVGEVLAWVMEDLAEKIARDGEGARKCITIHVNGARNDTDATKIARAIANSPLVKTAIAGSDPNWGRILCAAGYAGAAFDPAKVSIKMQGVTVCRNGIAADFDEGALKKLLDQPNTTITLTIAGKGKGRAQFWTCDLTERYIEINGSYRT
jgi:glutamate N-acetyltransferase/amino-acid N-acetyltransferase